MARVHELSRSDARRIAVRAQLLTKDRPTDLLDTVRRLSLLQLEPTNAVAPSADLVMWSRLGSAYSPQDLQDAVDEQRLIDVHGTVRVPEDIALYRAEMDEWPGSGELRDWQEDLRAWLMTNNDCRRDILERLRADGPLPASEFPDTCVRPWASSGWNNNRNVRMMLDLLVQRGEVAAAGGSGRERLWDLASRVYPDDPPVPSEDAPRLRAERQLRALGIARSKAAWSSVEPLGGAGGATTSSRSCTATGWSGSSTPGPTARTAPSASRRSIETLPFSKAMTVAVRREIKDLARWLELELVLPA